MPMLPQPHAKEHARAPEPNSNTPRQPIFHMRARGDNHMQRRHMLNNIISLVSGCVTFLGGFLVVWGAVSLGLAIR